MPHPQLSQNVRYGSMPGLSNMPGNPSPQIMYHPGAAAPYGSAGSIQQWQLAPPTGAASPAPSMPQTNVDRGTPNQGGLIYQPEYQHFSQLHPGFMVPGTGGSGSTTGYSPNNTVAAAPSPHPQQQQPQ